MKISRWQSTYFFKCNCFNYFESVFNKNLCNIMKSYSSSCFNQCMSLQHGSTLLKLLIAVILKWPLVTIPYKTCCLAHILLSDFKAVADFKSCSWSSKSEPGSPVQRAEDCSWSSIGPNRMWLFVYSWAFERSVSCQSFPASHTLYHFH